MTKTFVGSILALMTLSISTFSYSSPMISTMAFKARIQKSCASKRKVTAIKMDSNDEPTYVDLVDSAGKRTSSVMISRSIKLKKKSGLHALSSALDNGDIVSVTIKNNQLVSVKFNKKSNNFCD